MVTNLPEEAKAQWRRVIAARSPEEKLEELKKFYSLIPKHKGTKNLLIQITRQMARLREEIEERKRKKVGTYVSRWELEKHGIARIAILSADQLLAERVFRDLADKEVEESERWRYEPIYGILSDGIVQFQLVLLPPYGHSDSLDNKIYSFIKGSVDFLLIPSYSVAQLNEFLSKLSDEGLYVGDEVGDISIEKYPTGGIRVIGGEGVNREELIALLRSYKIYNAVVKIHGNVSLSDIEDYILGIRAVKRGAGIILNGSPKIYRIANCRVADESFSYSVGSLVEVALSSLNLIRVYTKPIGGQVSNTPLILPKGSRVVDLAERIHSRLVENFKYAIVERGGNKIRTSRNFVLEDGDVVTIYA